MITGENIEASYGNIQVLWDLSITIEEDDGVIAIVGSNGAGKSTLLKILSGLHPVDSGEVSLWGTNIADLDPSAVVQKGFVQVSEERNLFGEMTVEENLQMGAYTNREDLDENLADVYETFPKLAERSGQRAASLSGGEQQMLAIGRGLMAEPKILALDEPSEGLAPQITTRMFEKIEEISEDITVVIIEQHINRTLEMAERAYLLENGEIITEDTGTALLNSDHVEEAYL